MINLWYRKKCTVKILSKHCQYRRKYLKSRIYVRAFVNDSKISNIISSAFLIQIDDGQPLMSRRVYCKNIQVFKYIKDSSIVDGM